MDGDPYTPSFSDRRFKTDLEWVGMSAGLPIWRNRYPGSARRLKDVMARDEQAPRPEAVVRRASGLPAMRYHQLGLRLREMA